VILTVVLIREYKRGVIRKRVETKVSLLQGSSSTLSLTT
jgi:hypothetical protein